MTSGYDMRKVWFSLRQPLVVSELFPTSVDRFDDLNSYILVDLIDAYG